jgi:hypothetical protein
MASLKLARSNRRLKCAARLSITLGLAVLFTGVLLWELHSVTPIHADPGIVYVDGKAGQDIGTCGTASMPCKSISYALSSRASGGDTIRVAQGVYIENLSISIGITLEGGYEPVNWTRNVALHETIIDGSGATYPRPVIDVFAGGAGSTFDGVTMQNGNADYSGGGMSIDDDVNNVTVRNSTIISNTALLGGGGIYVGKNANTTITGCKIMKNKADTGGGLQLSEASSAIITGNSIMSNTAIAGTTGQGGGIAAYDSKGTIIGNQIISNTATGSDSSGGGGVFLWGGNTDFTIENNSIESNTAEHGGGLTVGGDAHASIAQNEVMFNTAITGFGGLGIEWNGGAIVDRNMIAHNNAPYQGGAGTWNTSQPVTFTNNIIVHNSNEGVGIEETVSASLVNNTIAFNTAEGVKIVHSTVHLQNNIVVGSTNCGIHVIGDEPSTVTLAYDNFWSNTPENYCNISSGTNDISADPKFVATDADDFHLRSNSPCVDAGTNIGVPSNDFDSDPRPLDGNLDGVATADIGADEFRPYRTYLPLTLRAAGGS